VWELKKLTVKAGRSSVRRVLVEEKVLPDPDRHAPKGVLTPWRKFIAIHMNVMVACDFFTESVWTPLDTRRLRTSRPSSIWALGRWLSLRVPITPTMSGCSKQARNASMWAEEEGIDVRFLIRDLTRQLAMGAP